MSPAEQDSFRRHRESYGADLETVPVRPLRIFIEAHMFDHGFEGAATFIAGLYRALLAAHPDRYQLFLGGRSPERALEALGNPTQAYPVYYRYDNRFSRLALDIPRVIRQARADFAHFQYFTPLVKACDWIVTIHDVLFNDFAEYFPKNYRKLRNVLFPLSARRADILTTVSEYSRERIAHWYGINPGVISITPNGVERTEVTQSGRSEAGAAGRPDGRYLICVSRFEPRKNQALVLDAFLKGELWKQGLSLVFVGSRTLASPSFDAAFDRAVPEAREAVCFLENVSHEAMKALYAGAEIAIYPSLAEGFGLPPLEALSFGVPSMCGKITAMADFDFLSPFFFDLTSADHLLSMLLSLLHAPAKARAEAEQAAKKMFERFAWARAAEVLHDRISLRFTERTPG